MMSCFDANDHKYLERFDNLPFKNKVIFVEKKFPEYATAFYITGYEDGLGVLSLFDGLTGKRKIDQFDYVKWFNEGL